MSDAAANPANPAAPPASPATPPVPPPSPAAEIARVPLGRLSAIEIHNYRAYRGRFRLELPKGENLLVYGENGAGKSSLFHTLRTFLEAPLLLRDHKHRFTPHEPSIKLEFGQRVFAWARERNDTGHEIVRSLNKGKGFLDYKALLEVHYVRSGEKQEINLFPLLLQHLLPHYTYSHRGTNRTFKERWDALRKEVKWTWRRTRSQREPEKDFLGDLTEFNEAFEKAVTELAKRASTMLAVFGDEFQVELRFKKAEFTRGPKRIEGPRVLALPVFRKLQCPDYHAFLNEARLSALAICLFLAAVKESPATGLRLLVLDDILIGLDMANRVKVIELIQEHFKSYGLTNWQFIILTYSKAWFERLKDHLHKPGSTPGWKSVVLWEDWRSEDSSPHIVAEGSGTLLEMAERHLAHTDYKAAAVYARSALEALCHHTCAKASLPVVHVACPKDQKLEHYIEVLERRLGQLRDETSRHTANKLIARLREAQAFVLNRNSHFDVDEEDTLSGEVKAAIQTVKDLADFFEMPSLWKKSNFVDGQTPPAAERMMVELAEARKLARLGPKEDALKKLATAHHLAWEAFGLRAKVALPIGTPLNAKAIWTAAFDQGKLDDAFEARLKAARPYLFGCAKPDEFDAAVFEEAAKLLEELCT